VLANELSMGALNDPLAWTSANLGCMPGSVEVKLVDVPELNYLTSHDPPKGEIWIRGRAVIEGYLDNPEENEKAFQDGWFRTGDIGLFDATGQLRIIDRKKNLVKTLNGEYIALEKVSLLTLMIIVYMLIMTQLESLYRSASIVNNICVYASATQAKPIAIVEPATSALRKIAAQLGLAHASNEELCKSDKMRAAVLAELLKVGKQNGLQGIEFISAVLLTDVEWTPASGLVTSAQKVNRRVVLERFENQIKTLC
jgi:long-chain acyl-CoA synthetase